MRFYSTRDKQYWVSAEQAIVENLCPKGGLFVPETIPVSNEFKKDTPLELSEIGFIVAKAFLSESFNEQELHTICTSVFNFPAPLVPLSKDISILELTYGPTLAFKDFGARFMAECLARIAARRVVEYQVLSATSGDTGGAAAAALHNKKGVKATILYPKGRISPFQEGQMTKWGDNIQTIAVEGSFDDCQRLVKEAFSNKEISKSKNLVSANSINISRLLPQMVYYQHALKLSAGKDNLTFVVPSGNLGNITAGIWASKFFDKSCKFLAAHNGNSAFPDYLKTGVYKATESKITISNAMDVGAPSNFERIKSFYNDDLSEMKKVITGTSISDQETIEEMQEVYRKYSYSACPHTAVGLRAAKSIAGQKIVLATAHPKKFSEVLAAAKIPFSDPTLNEKIMPPSFVIEPTLDNLVSKL